MKIPNYGTAEGLIFVALFALALWGFLQASGKLVKTTPKNVAITLGFAVLVYIDIAFIIANKP